MFREGTCPKCREKIQVPDDREKIICMFCGAEISVAEALGRRTEKKEISASEYKEYMEKAGKALEEIIRSCDNPMKDFKRDRYEGAFEAHYAQYRSLFEAVDMAYSSAEQPEACLQELVDRLVEAARKDLETVRSKSRRSQRQVDLNFLISIYLIPSALKYPASFSEPFTDCLVRTWNQSFETSIGKATYDNIAGGFRRKLCYITTAVCESLGKGPDCYELSVLKNYRDQYLEKTPEGHALVEEYYDIAPTIVKRMEREPERDILYRKLYQDYLMPCIQEIEQQEYDACQGRYREMVLELKARYLN